MKKIENLKKDLKRIVALGGVGVMLSSPIAVNAEGITNQDNMTPAERIAARMAKSDINERRFMTLEDFELIVDKAATELENKLDLKEFEINIHTVTRTCYLVNYAYINEELTRTLIEIGYIDEQDMMDENFKPKPFTEQGWRNIDFCKRLINTINNHNEVRIHLDHDHFKDEDTYDESVVIDPSHYINPAIFCFDKQDKKDATEFYMNWVNGYNLNKGTIMGNKPFKEAFEQLTQLNADSKGSDIFDASIGARWFMKMVTGQNVLQFEKDYCNEPGNFTEEELEQYFDKAKLRERQVIQTSEEKDRVNIVRDDFEINKPCVNGEIEWVATMMGITRFHVLEMVNDDFYSLLRRDEQIRESNKGNETSWAIIDDGKDVPTLAVRKI